MIDVINQAKPHTVLNQRSSQLHSHEVPIIAVECYFLYIAEAIDENAFLLSMRTMPP
jgi:hypothetical protein